MNSENDPSVLLAPTLVLPASQSSNANKAACTLINTSINVADHAAEQATGSTNAISSDKTTAVSYLCTPKKTFPDPLALQTIREQLERTPGKSCELQSLNLDCPINTTLLSAKIIKDRYLICVQPRQTQHSSFNNTLYTVTSSNLQCVDVFTGEQFLCKIINEPVHKVQRAYFQLLQNVNTQCWSNLYGHQLIRPVKEIIELNNKRTYVIQTPHIPTEYENAKHIQMQNFYEDLHTYIRDKRRLNEMEARSLFYQICETVLMCHRNGVILRDLKLKRFYFVDKARTKLQYESLEGSMILEDPNDDLLSDKIGCPLYTAPELLCPHPTYHGKPADMWSLGVMLYTMLVGQYPFYEKGSCNLIALIRHHNVQIPGNLSRSARRLLLDLLNKNYMERITITYTFLAPWLKEQCPLYMYAPIATEDGEDEEGEHDTFPSNWETETS